MEGSGSDIKYGIELIIAISGMVYFYFTGAKAMLLDDLKKIGIVPELYPKHYMHTPKLIRKVYHIEQEEIPIYTSLGLYYLLWVIFSLPLYILTIVFSGFLFCVESIIVYLWPISKLPLFVIHLYFHFWFKHKKKLSGNQ